LSKQRSATVLAEGRLLGAAIDKPAPQTIRSRPAFINASNRALIPASNLLP
jgi:hypothetical protein